MIGRAGSAWNGGTGRNGVCVVRVAKNTKRGGAPELRGWAWSRSDSAPGSGCAGSSSADRDTYKGRDVQTAAGSDGRGPQQRGLLPVDGHHGLGEDRPAERGVGQTRDDDKHGAHRCCRPSGPAARRALRGQLARRTVVAAVLQVHPGIQGVQPRREELDADRCHAADLADTLLQQGQVQSGPEAAIQHAVAGHQEQGGNCALADWQVRRSGRSLRRGCGTCAAMQRESSHRDDFPPDPSSPARDHCVAAEDSVRRLPVRPAGLARPCGCVFACA